MNLLRTKIWTWVDIGLLKWSVLLFGVVIGTHYNDIFEDYERMLLVVAAILVLKPVVDYLSD